MRREPKQWKSVAEGVRQQVGTDLFEIRVNVRDPLKGRHVERSKRIHGSLRDAKRLLEEMRVESRAKRPHSSQATLNQLVEAYLAHAKDKLAETTLQGYEGMYRRYIKESSAGPRPVRRITVHDFDEFFSSLRDTGLDPQTVNRVRALLSSAYAQGVRWDFVPQNTIKQTTRIPDIHKDPKGTTFEPVEAVIKSLEMDEPGMARILWLAVFIGCRRGEIVGLQLRDYDPVAKTLWVRRAVVELKGGRLVVKDTKKHNMRLIHLDSGAAAVLEDQISFLRKRAALDPNLPMLLAPTAFLWSDDMNAVTPWRPGRLSAAVGRMRKRCGVYFRLHDLRHLNGTTLLDSGVNVAVVSHRLGHKNQSTTLNIYNHVTSASQEAAVNVISEKLKRGQA